MSFILLISTAQLLAAADSPGVDLPRVDLTGVIADNTGKPVAGAKVFIYTAGPRQGTSPLCPSCYPDCAKKGETDRDGKFTIPQLDRELVFRVLVAAEGYQPKLVPGVNPAGEPLTTELTSLPTELDPRRTVRGRVVDALGNPIIGAAVAPFGIKTTKKRWWGSMPGVDPLALTNLRGEFVITSIEPDIALDLRVEGREHAPRIVELLPAGAAHDIVLGYGVGIHGRLVKDGIPAAGIAVGLVQVDQSAGRFLGHREIGTDANGEFEFLHVAPNEAYYLYTLMSSSGMSASDKWGALPIHEVPAGSDASEVALGELQLGPAHRLAGRVVLSDGKPLPPGTRLMLTREQAWDHQSATLDEEGRFDFAGVPEEAMRLIIRVPGYRLSPKRNRFQQTNGGLATFVDKDRLDVEIVLEPDPANPAPKPNAAASG
jgi:hypothetical protein